MSFFGKIFKGAGKLLKKNIGNVARSGLGLLTGGASEAVIRAAKPALAAVGSILKNKKAAALKIQPLSVRSSIAKVQLRPASRLNPVSMGAATTHPGGSPLKLIRIGKAKKKKAAPKKAPKKPAKAAKGKRQAPTGGKDFKALSASWKAAGKPGTWIAWVKAG